MKTIAENANDFSDLRTADGGNCVYVDKTDYFHRLVTTGSKKLFFIARPRRFGKSLMITTFKYIFEGRRELFRGLKIDRIDYENGMKARENDFDVSDIRNLRAVAMLYQTGYLTIKDYEDGDYTLGIPDEEVRRDLLQLVDAAWERVVSR